MGETNGWGNRSGVTLLELVIAIGILAALLGVSIPFTVRFYQRYQLDAERATFVALLRQAGSLSLGGQGSADHGVHIASSQFTLFEGSSYASRNQTQDRVFDRSGAVAISGPTEIVFAYLDATSASNSFTLTAADYQAAIHVNPEGSIDW